MNTEQGILLTSSFINKMSVSGELGWFPRETNASTGYTWRCTPDNSGVYEIVGETLLHPSTDAVGVPGMTLWQFKAVREGHGAVMFELFPPASKEACETVVIKIEVGA
jgi:predicted secreted protein